MMKDEVIVDEVVNEQKRRVSLVFGKFYRLLKSIKRDLGSQSDSVKSAREQGKPSI